jgi:hypothetical protein
VRDLEELRRIAEKATPGPWEWHVRDDTAGWGDVRRVSWWLNSEVREKDYERRYGRVVLHYEKTYPAGDRSALLRDPDADYIAAANPATVLALLDEIDRLSSSESVG